MSPEIRVFDTPPEVFRAAATEFAQNAAAAVRARGKFTVALSGGSTPKALYSLLASGAFPTIPWDKIYFFFGDERHVPPDHPDSNYRMANQALLLKTPVPAQNIFRMRAEEKDAEAAARSYQKDIQQFFQLSADEFPRFDLVLLGIGLDGHTASLFPGTAALQENSRLVVANYVDQFQTHRITFTFPVLNQAACVMFLVTGPDKAAIVHEIFDNPGAGLPSQKVQPGNGRLLWFLDRQAAASLQTR